MTLERAKLCVETCFEVRESKDEVTARPLAYDEVRVGSIVFKAKL